MQSETEEAPRSGGVRDGGYPQSDNDWTATMAVLDAETEATRAMTTEARRIARQAVWITALALAVNIAVLVANLLLRAA